MLSKHLNSTNFPKNSAKVQKAAYWKEQMKLLLLDGHTKIKEMRTTGYNDVETRCQ